jgi:hypothetical protein
MEDVDRIPEIQTLSEPERAPSARVDGETVRPVPFAKRLDRVVRHRGW